MDEESALGLHIKRGLALIVGLVGGFFLVYLLVSITASSRRGEPLEVNPKNVAESVAEAPYGAAVAPEANTGEEIFQQRCVACHGKGGRGDGLLAKLLPTAPRDLIKGPYWMRTTAWGQPPCEEDLQKILERGVSGTFMPGFEATLVGPPGEDSGIDKVTAFLRKKSPYLKKLGKAVEIKEQATGEDWEIEAGKAVYDALKCAECHGAEGHGDGPKVAELRDRRNYPVLVADLSEPWNFRRGPETYHIWMALELGLDKKFMPALTDNKCSPGDRLALAVYVRSLARRLLNPGDMKAARERRGLEHHGQNMVNLMACAHCHTAKDSAGLPVASAEFAGGVEIKTPDGVQKSANITPNKDSGIGSFKDEDIIAALREGEATDGHQISIYAMPWTWYSKLTTSDANAIVAYLKTVRPSSNKVPKGQQNSTGVFGRLGMMFGGGDPWVSIKTNPGATPEPDDSEEPEPDKADEQPVADKGKGKGKEKGDTKAAPEPEPAPLAAPEPEESPEEAALLNSPEARMAAAKARFDEAKARLTEASMAFARAEAEYNKAKAGMGSGKKKKKKSKKKKKKKRRRY